ncbi:MAG: hypothetical protein IKK70_01445 [Clostridia bacterium]|nr:hypothetical protein [Clostridia bacterium]
MDIKAKISEIVDKVKNDENIAESFKNDPVKTIEGLIGMDLPDDQVEQIVSGVKAKVSLDSLGGLGNKLGGLFGK